MVVEPMRERSEGALEPTLLHILRADEELHIQARSMDSVVAITDRRVIVTSGERIELDIPYEQLRRVQFDIERGRPATLVIVPEWPSDRPQVLAIPPRSTSVRHWESVASASISTSRGLRRALPAIRPAARSPSTF